MKKFYTLWNYATNINYYTLSIVTDDSDTNSPDAVKTPIVKVLHDPGAVVPVLIAVPVLTNEVAKAGDCVPVAIAEAIQLPISVTK